MDAFCFDYQHVDCLYTIFNYGLSGKFVINSGHLFGNVQRAVHLNHQNRRLDRMLSIAKKRLLRKKYRAHLLSYFQKIKLTQSSGSAFADRVEQAKKTKFEKDLVEIVDCFLDSQGNYNSKLVFLKKRFCIPIIF